MKTLFVKYWPILTIFLIWIAFSHPYIFKNQVPYPAIYQNTFFSPWSSYTQFSAPVKNNAISDVVTQIYPWKYFTIEESKKGNIPWWNPYSFSGTPHVADYQTAVFSPFNLLFFIMPFIDAWSILVLIQPLLAGLFTYLFLREIRISKEGSLLGSISFMFCGFITVWMPYATLALSIVFLPLALFAIERYYRTQNVLLLALLTISLVFSFFSGHFQMSLYLSAFVFAYIIYKHLFTKKRKLSLKVLTAFIIAIFISGIQIYPSLQLYRESVRSQLFSNEGAIPLSHLVTIFAPDFYGNPVTRNDWIGHYAEWAMFIGIIPLIMAFFAFGNRKNKVYTYFYLTIGLTSLIMALNTPVQSMLAGLQLPVFSTSIPSRIIVLFSFAFSILAAFGFDHLRNLLENRKYKNIFTKLFIFFIVFVSVWWVLFFLKPFPPENIAISKKNLIIPTGIFSLAVGLLISSFILRKKGYIHIVLIFLLVLTIFDSYRFAQKWVPFDPRNSVFPELPVVKAMKEEIGHGRIYGKFGSYIDTYYRLPSIEGYDPLYIRRYGEFLESAKTGHYRPAVKSLAVLDPSAKYADKVLNLLGVTVIYHVIGDTGKSWAYPVWKKDEDDQYVYSVIYQDEKFQLYDNKSALPRTKMFYDYEIIKQDKDIIARFYEDDFNYTEKLILEEEPDIEVFPGVPIQNSVKYIKNDPSHIIMEVNTQRAGLLFISDNFYKKWKAKVNNKEIKILRADYSFKAVEIQSGKSVVELYYSPWSSI